MHITRTRGTLAARMQRVGLLFIAPWFIGLLLFKLAPILVALWYSFTNFNMLHPEEARFIGLDNYVHFFEDPSAGASLFGSVSYFLFIVPAQLFTALGLALLFSSERLRGKAILRPLFFMPTVIPATSLFFLLGGLLDSRSGWITRLIIEPLGLPPLANTSGLGAILFTLYSIGPGFLIMLGAVQGISPELVEAARVDGAGPFTRLFSITLPIISPAIFFTLVLNLTAAFGGAVLLDRGFPYRSSPSPMENYINYTMFGLSKLGYASALTWIMFAVILCIIILLFRTSRSWVYFPEEEPDVVD